MCALICLQFLWKALTFLWYTSSPTCLLPTPCTIQLSDSRSLPTRDAFALRFSTSWFAVGFDLDFWWWVRWGFSLSNVLLSNVSGAQSQPDLRFWYRDPAVSRAARPFASRGAVISCGCSWYVLSQWNTTTMDAMPAVYVIFSGLKNCYFSVF